MAIRKTNLPDQALLRSYDERADCYADCYTTVFKRGATLEQYILAFYSTTLFRSERLILSSFFKSPSTDDDLARLARGVSASFAAWTVEARKPDQILLCDRSGRTRSWLMVEPNENKTRLYFGSAVTPAKAGNGLGVLFTALLPFHKLYARSLLRAAKSNLGQASAI